MRSHKESISKAAINRVIRDYLGQYKKYPFSSAVGLFVPALGSILIFFIPPLIIARIVNTFSAQGDTSISALSLWIGLFAFSWFMGEVLWRIGMHALIRAESASIQDLHKQSFHELIQRDYHFFTNHFVGTITKQTIAYARNFEKFTDTMSFQVINNIIPMIFACVILWQYSPVIPLVLLACIVGTIFIALPIIRRRMKLVIARHDAQSKTVGMLSDSISNILTVKSFAQEVSEETSFAACVDDTMMKWKKAANYQNLRFDTVISPIYVMTNVLGLIMSLFFVHRLNLPTGTLVVIYSYYASVTRTFWDINRVYRDLESCISESAEFTQMVLKPAEIQDKVHAPSLVVKKAAITFKNVHFSYGKKQEDKDMFLSKFDLAIKSNQKIGLVGPSGGGKTTITKLLLRFLDIKRGSISIDGQDISHVTQTSLRDHIAYVPQEPLLFHQSLYDNIAYGNKNATKEEVMQAAKLAHADEFIQTLPHGYETMVGERGIKLSGGQRQRIAIARAILKKASILILDEATSALDSESEKYIQEGFRELMKNKTALVIAHRLSTIKNLDRILVLADGKIVQDGTHDELIKQTGLYATLWGHQSGEFLVD